MHVQQPLGRSWPRGSLLSNLSGPDRDALLGLGSFRRYTPGEALMVEGGRDTVVALLLDGCVKVLVAAEDGSTVLLAIRAPGDVVGELAALDGRPRSATVLAARGTSARVISGVAFRGFLRERPDAATELQRSVAGKLRAAIRYRIDAVSGPVTVRLARTLDTLARAYGRPARQGLRIDVPLSNADLAALAGLSTASVQRGLRALRASGAIATEYRSVLVRDIAVLRAVAAGQDRPAAPGVAV
ncbi:Crp/Fnr family transcriptional regulator [Streptomyces sp. NPDC001315]|uniref:Crp/Fnr family transcriptional regulator n=1 Tax=Streptomyces sp. NPDC001315 TaxID=3364562 RepID=UPI00368BD2D1